MIAWWAVPAYIGVVLEAKVSLASQVFVVEFVADSHQDRAMEAPVIRRLFSTSPRDPRYHMLAHLSAKFEAPVKPSLHEPRAALFLNRFTRTLAIMYATNGLKEELGISGDELMGRSFYHCIQHSCLNEAVRCLENAKANDSIAYLRFWFRDPRQDDASRRRQISDDAMEVDSNATETGKTSRSLSEDTDMGGVKIEQSTPPALSPSPVPALERHDASSGDSQAMSSESSVEPVDDRGARLAVPQQSDSRTSSGDSMEPQNTTEHIFGETPSHQSSESSAVNSPLEDRRNPRSNHQPYQHSVELEAVVSCTSDGLVVCLRRARAPVPLAALDQIKESARQQQDGTFAVPWATNPIMPQAPQQMPQMAVNGVGISPAVAAAPSGQDFMNSIREIAVFAWALTGINGSLAQYSHGQPRGESQPAQGLPIWQPNATEDQINAMQTRDGAHPGP